MDMIGHSKLYCQLNIEMILLKPNSLGRMIRIFRVSELNFDTT